MSLWQPPAEDPVRFGRQTCRPTMSWLPQAADTLTITSGVQYLFTFTAHPGAVFTRATFFTDSTTSQVTNASSHLFFSLYDKAETVMREQTQQFSGSASTDKLTLVAHGRSINDAMVVQAASGCAPLDSNIGVTYWIISSGFDADTIHLSTSPGGAGINITSDGTADLSVAAEYARLAVSADVGASWSWSASTPKTLDFGTPYSYTDSFSNQFAIGILAVYNSGSLKLKGVTLDSYLSYGGGHDGQNGGLTGMPIGMKARTIIHTSTGLTASPTTVISDDSSADRAKLAYALVGDYPTRP